MILKLHKTTLFLNGAPDVIVNSPNMVIAQAQNEYKLARKIKDFLIDNKLGDPEVISEQAIRCHGDGVSLEFTVLERGVVSIQTIVALVSNLG